MTLMSCCIYAIDENALTLRKLIMYRYTTMTCVRDDILFYVYITAVAVLIFMCRINLLCMVTSTDDWLIWLWAKDESYIPTPPSGMVAALRILSNVGCMILRSCCEFGGFLFWLFMCRSVTVERRVELCGQQTRRWWWWWWWWWLLWWWRYWLVRHRYTGNKMSAPFMPLWTRMCLFKFPDWENRSKHNLHWYGFSPECIRRCLVSVDESLNAFLHNRHRYGRSPEWVRMWVVTDDDCENRRSHIWHRKGFSPEWVRTCAVRLAAWLNDLLQSSHRYGFSPECVRRCVLSVLGRAYVLPHIRHMLGRQLSSPIVADPTGEHSAPPMPQPLTDIRISAHGFKSLQSSSIIAVDDDDDCAGAAGCMLHANGGGGSCDDIGSCGRKSAVNEYVAPDW